MPKLGIPEQTELYKGINYALLKKIIDQGIATLGPLILEYNKSIEPGRARIDVFNNAVILEIADFLRSEGKEKEARRIENLLKKDNRAEELKLLEEKPITPFKTFAEKSQPKEAE